MNYLCALYVGKVGQCGCMCCATLQRQHTVVEFTLKDDEEQQFGPMYRYQHLIKIKSAH